MRRRLAWPNASVPWPRSRTQGPAGTAAAAAGYRAIAGRFHHPPGRCASQCDASAGPLARPGPAGPGAGPDPNPAGLAARPAHRPDRARPQLRRDRPIAGRLPHSRHPDRRRPGLLPRRRSAPGAGGHQVRYRSGRRAARRHCRRVAGWIRSGARPGPLAGHLACPAGRHPGPRPGPLPVRRRRRSPAAAPGRRRLLAAVRAVRRPPADGGRGVDAARPVAADRLGRGRDGGPAVNSWHDLVAASLIGTERSVVPAVGIPGLPPAEDDPGDPAAVLLDRAALLTAARRAGRRPDRAEPPPVCAPDPRPTVSPAAARRLRRLISGEHPDLLTEWLAAAVARGLRLPPELLPALLDRARRGRPADPGLPRLLAQAGGPRARWLAGLNPDWEHAAEEPSTDDETWRLGDARQRRGYLASLLARDPNAGRALITGGWDAAGAADRVMFLSVLADALGPADEPLLEAALDDRAEDVRRWAAYLLARLPGSALGQRMAERALRYVRVEQTVPGPR